LFFWNPRVIYFISPTLLGLPGGWSPSWLDWSSS
jgi:hypothetical protein